MEFEKLKKIIAEVLNVDEEEITMETTFVDDLGADSLDVFQIIMGLEEEFDIEIPNEEAEKIVTVGDAVEQAGLHLEEIDLFLLHQANYRIIEAVSKRLGQPMEKFPTNLEECGNISAASVPILLDNVNNHGMMRKGMKIVLAGFGAGLTWGATVINW